MATLAFVLALQTPTPAEEAWALKLGKERSQYGDIPNSGLWKHGYTGQFGGTFILFRAGSSTERYYVTSSPGADRWRISRTTLVQGKIRKDWLVFVEKGKEPRIKKPGPLWKWTEGGRIVGAIPKMALSDLQSQVPLALYHSNVHISYCYFIGPNGHESEQRTWEPEIVTNLGGGGYSADFSKLPRTEKPYPITPEERAYAYHTRSYDSPELTGCPFAAGGHPPSPPRRRSACTSRTSRTCSRSCREGTLSRRKQGGPGFWQAEQFPSGLSQAEHSRLAIY